MGIPDAGGGGVGPGGSRLTAIRARFWGLTAGVARIFGAGKRPPRFPLPPPMIFRGFLGYPQFPKFAEFPGILRRRILRRGTGLYPSDSGRRGGRSRGVRICSQPGRISGDNSLGSPDFSGHPLLAQVAAAPCRHPLPLPALRAAGPLPPSARPLRHAHL